MSLEPDFTMLSELWTDVRGTREEIELEDELAREITSTHVLAGVGVSAVAARKLRKEIIYRLSDGRWAWVHLTWSKETNRDHPRTEICESWPIVVDEVVDAGRE